MVRIWLDALKALDMRDRMVVIARDGLYERTIGNGPGPTLTLDMHLTPPGHFAILQCVHFVVEMPLGVLEDPFGIGLLCGTFIEDPFSVQVYQLWSIRVFKIPRV